MEWKAFRRSHVCHIKVSERQARALPCLSSAFVSGPGNFHYSLLARCGQQHEREALSNPPLIMYF